MALFHRATITPTKEDIIAATLGAPIESIGAFRFDDPDGRVGMETFLVRTTSDGVLHQVGLTYRDEPLEDAADGALLSEMDHSALGRRWVYDGLQDPRYVVMLAAVTMTGQ
ncbi:MAG TPA: hypothetical protein VEA78_11975, partial [Acidimicrobiales bacterium]|nr:hypothetical protein [Acidimicrobiales bacterium]